VLLPAARKETFMAREQSESLTPRPIADVRTHRRWASPLDATHVVVCGQELWRVSPAIQALASVGYVVTAYTSRSRLLPCFKLSDPVELLVIDGRESPALARASVMHARMSFPDLPIILLSSKDNERQIEATRYGVNRVLLAPVADQELVRNALELAPVVRDMPFDRVG
jgi:CheY-like chemotaxis protein